MLDMYRVTAIFLLIAIDCGHFAITFPRSVANNGQDGLSSYQTDTALNIGFKIIDLVKGENPVISPINLYTCLWFLHLGAKGDTKMELGEFLQVADTSSSYHIGKLQDVHTANAAFVDVSAPVKYQFIQATNNSIFSVNFKDDQNSRAVINGWVSEQTKGSIPNLLSDPLEQSTTAIIVSALYFNAPWLYPFNPAVTKRGKFEVSPNEFIQVPFMALDAKLPNYKGASFNAVGLPYVNNGFTMYFLMPHVSGPRAINNLIKHLSAEEVSQMIASMTEESVIVSLPKLQLNYQTQLKSTLQSLGVNKMFDRLFADFSEMVEETNGSKVFVSEMIHSVHLDVDEGGTRGGAATATILTKSSRWVFRANRPFVYLLRHTSGLVLFLGTVTNPHL